MLFRVRAAAVVLACACLSAGGASGTGPAEAGRHDRETADAGRHDGGTAHAGPREGGPQPEDGRTGPHRRLDAVLDLYVRDGLVYYRALKSDRARLDRYVAALDVPPATYSAWPRDERAAFWLNAYNAFVLHTVVNQYPIRGSAAQYPANSIRQIPGAFDRLPHRAAGRKVTLDQIEKTVLPEFKDPRLYLALGRGAVGSGRLRSEAYSASRLDEQLKAVRAELSTRAEQLRVDMAAGRILVTPIVGWHEAEFVAAFGATDPGRHAHRSPIERAILSLISPHLLPMEREFVAKAEFTISYQDFDWRLNDLTGGRP